MKMNASELKMKFEDSNIENSQKNPIYKALKNKLMSIPVKLSGYDYYQMEIPSDGKEKELTSDGKFLSIIMVCMKRISSKVKNY